MYDDKKVQNIYNHRKILKHYKRIDLNCLLLHDFCVYGCTERTQQSIRTAYVKENSFPSGKRFLKPNSLLENQWGIKRKIVVNSVSAEILSTPNFITLFYIPWL